MELQSRKLSIRCFVPGSLEARKNCWCLALGLIYVSGFWSRCFCTCQRVSESRPEPLSPKTRWFVEDEDAMDDGCEYNLGYETLRVCENFEIPIHFVDQHRLLNKKIHIVQSIPRLIASLNCLKDYPWSISSICCGDFSITEIRSNSLQFFPSWHGNFSENQRCVEFHRSCTDPTSFTESNRKSRRIISQIYFHFR